MEPDTRREAILDAAQSLFMAQGWDAVTIADVLRAAGISKGGFYHHFAAKEDLLDGIVLRITDQSIVIAKAARDRTDGDALVKLNAFFASSIRWKADNIEELRALANVLLRPGNDLLFQRVFTAIAASVVPVLRDMIAEGVREGLFDVADPRLAAEIIVGLSQGRQQILIAAIRDASDGHVDAAAERLDARMQAEGATCDRLLGLPPGSLALSNPGAYRRMLAALAADAPDAPSFGGTSRTPEGETS